MSQVSNLKSPIGVVESYWRHRALIWQLARREVIGRYRGSVMGLMWSFFHPLLMLLVYTVIFSVVFRARWDVKTDNMAEFALVLFIGMIIHGLFAECVNRAPSLMLGNVNYVKKVVFPLEVFPWISMGSALFHMMISILVFIAAFLVFHLYINPTVILFPVVIIPLVLLTMGISWFLASMGVYLRDVGHATGIITTVMLFLAPVFYPVSAIPEAYRVFIYLNPLTFIIEESRNVLIWGKTPNWIGLGVYFAISLTIAWAGLVWFQKTRRGFADVL